MNDNPSSSAFDDRQLCLWLATLSPGDLSVNEGAAARPGSAMITSVGSHNDVLWSQMERADWTQRIAVDDVPMAHLASSYTFTETGARAVKTAIAELISRKVQLMRNVKGFDGSAPERVRQLCGVFSWLGLRAISLLTLAQEAKPRTSEAQARQRDCILALEEIRKGVSMAGLYIAEAISRGPDSDIGQDCLERTTKGLRYAEQCLMEWTAEMYAERPGKPSLLS
ncbi:hypothetical protein [Bradyrhizobium embrapense]|uniref:hypothetical protein n=1 Tax=Bradyrhizobium embrapense TaxID=630921 RepID=UPI000A7038A7|nr:hypothetical protein [Bradyrhizobium embrapense]